MRTGVEVRLGPGDRERLEAVLADGKSPQRHVWRVRIVLLTADGVGTMEIARRTGISKPTVWRWQRRFMEGGVPILLREPSRKPGRAPLTPDVVRRVVETALHVTPENATHWSVRSLALEMGISSTSVHRIWKAHGIKPHLLRSFKLSRDPQFVDKLHDVVGLYLNPPEHALVLSVDEKSQIQALDRTQPGLPMKKGRAGTMTHDYRRHGTTTLFAALNVLEGKVIGQCMPRHRSLEFVRFLRKIDRETAPHLDLHLIVDNYATHKTQAVQRWLDRHPRFHLHFTPTSASWLNAVEGFFARLTNKRLKRGVFRSVPELQSAIDAFIVDHNQNANPFVWTASADSIIQKVNRGNRLLESHH
jgi:transposase